MSKRSWMKVIDDFNGHDGYMEHAKSIPRDESGEVVEMQGELGKLCRFHFGNKYTANKKLSEKQLRQQLTIFAHFHPMEQNTWEAYVHLTQSFPKEFPNSVFPMEPTLDPEGNLPYIDEPIPSSSPDHDTDAYCFFGVTSTSTTEDSVLAIQNHSTSHNDMAPLLQKHETSKRARSHDSNEDLSVAKLTELHEDTQYDQYDDDDSKSL